jgi:hypothetical protein
MVLMRVKKGHEYVEDFLGASTGGGREKGKNPEE